MKQFDNIVMNACDVSDANVEPQPLWEYPCRALANPVRLAKFEFGAKTGPPESSQSYECCIDIDEENRNQLNGKTMPWLMVDICKYELI